MHSSSTEVELTSATLNVRPFKGSTPVCSVAMLAFIQKCMFLSIHYLQFLYDLVFDKDDPNFIGASKTHRDTRNRTMQSKDRNLGDTMTTNALTYTPPEDFIKPDYARKPVIRDTFYRGEGKQTGDTLEPCRLLALAIWMH